MNNIVEQVETQLNSEPVFEAAYEEFNIDMGDDPAILIEELNQEINYWLKRIPKRYGKDWNEFYKDLKVRYPNSYMFDGYANCIIEITLEGNICYDFLKMIRESAYSMDCAYCFERHFKCFCDLEGLEELLKDLHVNIDTKNCVEPILVFNGLKMSWHELTYTDYQNPYFDEQIYEAHLAEEELGTCDRDWELDFFPAEETIESLTSEWQD